MVKKLDGKHSYLGFLERCLEPSQTSTIELFGSIVDVQLDSKCLCFLLTSFKVRTWLHLDSLNNNLALHSKKLCISLKEASHA